MTTETTETTEYNPDAGHQAWLAYAEKNTVTQRIRVEPSAMQHGNANLFFLDADGKQFMRICVAGYIAERMLDPVGYAERMADPIGYAERKAAMAREAERREQELLYGKMIASDQLNVVEFESR